MNPPTSFSIYPLGDSAITIDLRNFIDERLNNRALALYDWLQRHRFPGITDIIMAYSSVSVFYDPTALPASDIVSPARRDAASLLSSSDKPPRGSAPIRQWLTKAWAETSASAPPAGIAGRSFRIPVCYEGDYAPDLEEVARKKGLSREEVIYLHHSRPYRIYMIGFLPGFPYLGKIAERLEVARKDRPVPVPAGGVGIAGIQTGIYPLNSPGGWQIIGRTPVKLFERLKDPPVLLRAGDMVQFYPVSAAAFSDWNKDGQRCSG